MRALVTAALAISLGAAGCGHDKNPLSDARDPVDAAPCPGAACMPEPCHDGIKDGQETDVDCGGSCLACAAGQDCNDASDCVTGNCSADTHTCSLGSVTFADAVSYGASFKPYVILSADLDGDGDVDLAVANEEASTITMFRNIGNSSGQFVAVPGSTRDGFPTGEYPTGGLVADFNRDGIPDVITANYHGNSVTILLGAGSGDAYTLAQPTSYPTAEGAATSNLAVGDLTGDGIPDVIATNPQMSSFSVFIGRGDGTLEAARNVAVGIAGVSEPFSVAIGDFDGDGIDDAAVAEDYSATMFIELGNGDGTFHLAPVQPAIAGVAAFIVIVHDMNRDGNLDLIVADRSSDGVSVLLGLGDGTFRAALVSPTGPGTGPYALAVADFDLDGVPDIVTADYTSSTASVLLGVGDGRFHAPIDAGQTGQFTYGVATGDFNGDGKPDFATANALSGDMTVKLSTAH